MPSRRRPKGRLLLWEAGFLVWIGLCYLIVCGRYGLVASPADAAITYAIFALPSLLGGLIAWSLISAGLRVRRDSGRGGRGEMGLLLAGLLVCSAVLGGVLGLIAMFGAGAG